LDPILNKMNPIYTLSPYFIYIHVNTIFLCTPTIYFPTDIFPSYLPTKMSHVRVFLIPPSPCVVHLILLNLMTLIILKDTNYPIIFCIQPLRSKNSLQHPALNCPQSVGSPHGARVGFIPIQQNSTFI
jgi:hypothetical protein